MKITKAKKFEYEEFTMDTGKRYRRYSDGNWDHVVKILGCDECFRLNKTASFEQAYQEYKQKNK